MRVIPPITITSSKLASTTVVEVAPALWSGATTYALDTTVSIAGTLGVRSVYKSLQASNLNHAPASNPTWWEYLNDTYQAYSTGTTYALGERVNDNTNHLAYESAVAGNLNQPLTDITKWLPLGANNTYAMFDLLRNTQSISNGTQTIVVNPGERVDSIAFVGLSASSIRIVSESSSLTIYDKTYTLSRRKTTGWYSYFFGTFYNTPTLVVFDLPPVSNATITITVTNLNGQVKVGGIIFGKNTFIGYTQYGAENSVINFSEIKRTFDSGLSELVQRRNVSTTKQQLLIPADLIDTARYIRDSLNAVPAMWFGIDDIDSPFFESLAILGIIRNFPINNAYTEHAIITLELEEI